jgi:hypothetical protein
MEEALLSVFCKKHGKVPQYFAGLLSELIFYLILHARFFISRLCDFPFHFTNLLFQTTVVPTAYSIFYISSVA